MVACPQLAPRLCLPLHTESPQATSTLLAESPLVLSSPLVLLPNIFTLDLTLNHYPQGSHGSPLLTLNRQGTLALWQMTQSGTMEGPNMMDAGRMRRGGTPCTPSWLSYGT